jgi:tetratricopeptide (TPR) repeat protein
MKFLRSLFLGVLPLLVGAVLSGCLPSAQGPQDEEREPHFLAGMSRLRDLNYPGAIESFEKALEVNPQSAAAHFQLGCLFDQKQPDPARAIYHYSEYLRLRPKAPNTNEVKMIITTCKQELARQVLVVSAPNERIQRELERLVVENKRIKEELDQWQAYAHRLETMTNPPPAAAPLRSMPGPVAGGATARPATAGAGPVSSPGAGSRAAAPPSAAPRSHVVKPGETMAIIARQYNVRLEALMSANPKVTARRMRAGQTLVIPAP